MSNQASTARRENMPHQPRTLFSSACTFSISNPIQKSTEEQVSPKSGQVDGILSKLMANTHFLFPHFHRCWCGNLENECIAHTERDTENYSIMNNKKCRLRPL